MTKSNSLKMLAADYTHILRGAAQDPNVSIEYGTTGDKQFYYLRVYSSEQLDQQTREDLQTCFTRIRQLAGDCGAVNPLHLDVAGLCVFAKEQEDLIHLLAHIAEDVREEADQNILSVIGTPHFGKTPTTEDVHAADQILSSNKSIMSYFPATVTYTSRDMLRNHVRDIFEAVQNRALFMRGKDAEDFRPISGLCNLPYAISDIHAVLLTERGQQNKQHLQKNLRLPSLHIH